MIEIDQTLTFFDAFLECCLKRLDNFSARKIIEIDRNCTFSDAFLECCIKRLDNFSARKTIEIERVFIPFWDVARSDWLNLVIEKGTEKLIG